MPRRVEERVRPITPQLAWRVAVLGGFAFVLFAIVFFRLWYLQVLTGQEAVSAARDNRVRKLRIEAPRGDIVDRNGIKLVDTKEAAVVQIVPAAIPASVATEADDYRKASAAAENDRLQAGDQLAAYKRQLRDDGKKTTKAEARTRARLTRQSRKARPVAIEPVPPTEPKLIQLYARLGRVIGDSPRTIHNRVIRGLADAPYSNVTIATGVRREEFNYLREYAEKFPGVVVETRDLRDYPHGTLAAQIFGRVFQISPAQLLDKKDYGGIAAGTDIGQSGLEEVYDKYLRGTDGYTKVVVNALGTRDDQRRATVKEPQKGQRLKLTLDYNLEKAGDSALAEAIAAASKNGANAGAYIAMDPRDGSILAMGSQPSFDANIFAKPFSQKTYDYLTSKSTGAPLLDRVTESGYPTGSTFKPVTALATMEGGVISPNKTIDDTGTLTVGPQHYQNAKKAAFGPLQMASALTVSSDIFFFTLGWYANDWTHPTQVIQKMARKLGFGAKTDIDLPGEQPGLVPDAAWRDKGFDAYVACTEKAHLAQGSIPALFKCGGIDKQWTAGDNINLAVGQGDLEATPLQLAVAYSAIENGGTIVRPHLGAAIEDNLGRTLQEFRTKPRRKVKLDPRYRQVVLDGLRGATTDPKGTSTDVFKGFPKQYTVYGKTGTAERYPNPDQAWYACFVKDRNRPIVVIVTVEKGGFGAETAAPAARLILSQWFDVKDRTFHAGASATL
jgi:penicillin-binding protein 2